MQGFSAWCRLRGLLWDDIGPNLIRKRDRTAIYAGLISPTLGKDRHIWESLKLPTPFAPHDWPELDDAFFLDGVRVWRGALPRWCQHLPNVLRKIAVALQPLKDAFARWRVPSAVRVASSKKPDFLTLVALY